MTQIKSDTLSRQHTAWLAQIMNHIVREALARQTYIPANTSCFTDYILRIAMNRKICVKRKKLTQLDLVLLLYVGLCGSFHHIIG